MTKKQRSKAMKDSWKRRKEAQQNTPVMKSVNKVLDAPKVDYQELVERNRKLKAVIVMLLGDL